MVYLKTVEGEAKTLAATEEAKAKSWFTANWLAFSIGLVCGLLVSYVAHKL